MTVGHWRMLTINIKYTQATRQNGHKNETYWFEKANSLDFPVVSVSISFLSYLPSSLNVGKLAPRSAGHGLWHQTLHFRFDDVNHPPSGDTKKSREEQEIKRYIGGAGRIGRWTGNEHDWKGERRGGEWEGMEGWREGGDMKIWSRQMLACEVRDGAQRYSHTSGHETGRWERKTETCAHVNVRFESENIELLQTSPSPRLL